VIKRIYRSTVEGDRLRGRPRKGWRDGVKEALSHRGMSIQEGERHVWDRVSWSDVVYRERHAAEIWNLKQCEGAGVNTGTGAWLWKSLEMADVKIKTSIPVLDKRIIKDTCMCVYA